MTVISINEDDFILEGYEDLELSTQMILREAFARGIEVDILDRRDNFIRLRKGPRTEYVRKGTETALDPLISYFLMENKQVTKKVLDEAGFRVPKGEVFHSMQDALHAYPKYSGSDIIVKPNFTNFGVAVTMVPAGSPDVFQTALHDAFVHGSDVIVEEFFPGQEYRFLVMRSKLIAVCKRLPANVVGDGSSTIRQLVRRKNRDPKNYKTPDHYIHLRKEEKQVLSEQGRTPDTIPAAGEQVFLRYNSNVSTGGDPIDVTDEATEAYAKLAIEAAELAQAHFCGVDLIVHNFQEEPNPDNHCFIELNFNPALYLHRYPVEGKKRYVEKDVLDALGF